MFNIICGQLLSTVTFDEIIKDKFKDQFTDGQLNLATAALSLLVSLAVGVLIYLIYRLTFRGVVYSSSFAMSLIMMSVITTVIIVTISSNVVLSLGMVGALSIVRFRAAIKDPVDIMYLFWAISMGIVIGAQQYLFAVISSLIIAVLCFIMYRVQGKANVYLVIIRYEASCAESVNNAMSLVKARVRNKTSTSSQLELTAEVKESNLPKAFVEKLCAITGVHSAVLVNYNGEYCN